MAEKLGMPITHMDSHMGTLFYVPEYFERYVKVGIEKQIPMLIISGYNVEDARQQALAQRLQEASRKVWEAGLPVLDHLTTSTADTSDPDVMVETLIKNLRNLKPGITQIILHGTRPGQNFSAISGSGGKREAELEMVLSDKVRQVVEEEGIILTTYKELMKRRQQVPAAEK